MTITAEKIERRQKYVNRERARIEAERNQPSFDADAIARMEAYLDETQGQIDAAKANLEK